jgi:hypothetical protein
MSTLNEIFDELLGHELTDSALDDHEYIKRVITFRIKSNGIKLDDEQLALINMLHAVKWFKDTHEVIGYRPTEKGNLNG